jgi:hypothetical protein
MQKIKVVILILPEVHILDLAGPDQVFLEAIGYDAPFEISYCATESNIFTSSNLPFGVLQHFSEVTLERNAWVEHILKKYKNPNIETYLNTVLNCDV